MEEAVTESIVREVN